VDACFCPSELREREKRKGKAVTIVNNTQAPVETEEGSYRIGLREVNIDTEGSNIGGCKLKLDV